MKNVILLISVFTFGKGDFMDHYFLGGRKDSFHLAGLFGLCLFICFAASVQAQTYTDSAIDALSGTISSGTLTFDTADDSSHTLNATLSGSAAVIKTGGGAV